MDISYALYLKNNSNHSIGFYFSLGGNFGTFYPDTILPTTNQYVIPELKSENRYIYDSGLEWKKIVNDLPADTLSIFIFHSDTLNKYPWEEVREGYKVLIRYDLSAEDLKKLDDVITYPPSAAMEEIKMWPQED